MAIEDRAAVAPPHSAMTTDVVRFPDNVSASDQVAVEEPLEIRIGGVPIAVTMRTPGHDEELAVGFCISEGIRVRSARVPDDLAANTIDVAADAFDPKRVQRNFYTSSSCGVCGKGALEAVAVEAPRVESGLRVTTALVTSLPDQLRAAQPAFAQTGGVHATGLFDRSGELLCVREDVGRHNAMDKVIGWAHASDALPLANEILCVSGRLSFELVQKAAVAGCPIVVAGLRASENELTVVLPVDVPLVRAPDLRRLADACIDVAVPQTGPLPCAIRRTALSPLERRLAAHQLALRDAFAELDTHVVELDPQHLVNVNAPADLEALQLSIVPFRAADAEGFRALVADTLHEFGFSADPGLDPDLADPAGSYSALWVALIEGHAGGSSALREPRDATL